MVAGRPRREFTPNEIAIAEQYAADPNKSQLELRKALRIGKDNLDRMLQECDIKWVNCNTNRRFTDEQP